MEMKETADNENEDCNLWEFVPFIICFIVFLAILLYICIDF